MAYASEADLVDAAGGLARLEEVIPPDNADATTGAANRQYWIDGAIVKGDAVIDSYLPPRYKTPLATPSEHVIRLAAEEALFWLRGAGSNQHTENDLAGKELRLIELKMLQSGKLWPGDPLPEQTSGGRSVIVKATNKWSLERQGKIL